MRHTRNSLAILILLTAGCVSPFWSESSGSATPDRIDSHGIEASAAARLDESQLKQASEIRRITDQEVAPQHRQILSDQLSAVVEHVAQVPAETAPAAMQAVQSPRTHEPTVTPPTPQPATAHSVTAQTPAAQLPPAQPISQPPAAPLPTAHAPNAHAPNAQTVMQASATEPVAPQPSTFQLPPETQALANQQRAPGTPPMAPLPSSLGAQAALPTTLVRREQTASLDHAAPTIPDATAAPEVEEEPLPDWPTQLENLIESLESDLASDPHGQDAIQRQVSLRLLYLIADRREHVADPVSGLAEDDREFLKHAVYGLMVWLDRDGRHANTRKAALALRELRTAADFLANQSTLDVRNLTLCKAVNSYGDYTEFKPASFRPGAEVVLYVEIENFVSEPIGAKFETELQGEYTIFDATGQRVSNVVLPLDKQQCDNRRRDYFIPYLLRLPKDLRPGEFQLVLTVEDVKGRKSNQATVDFRIR